MGREIGAVHTLEHAIRRQLQRRRGAGPDPVALKGISLHPGARLGELELAPDLPIHAGYGRRSQPFS